jgi:hypothetical protein
MYNVPNFLIIVTLGSVALIYWGGFIEERRHRA